MRLISLPHERLAHGEVVLEVAGVQRGDELDGQLGGDRVEAGRAHAGAADLELAGGDLREDLRPAGQPDHLDA